MDLTPSSDLCRHPYMSITHTHTHTHIFLETFRKKERKENVVITIIGAMAGTAGPQLRNSATSLKSPGISRRERDRS